MDKEKNKPLADQKIVIKTRSGEPMIVPPEGALGLLALGYKGLIAWRQARRQFMQNSKKQNQSNVTGNLAVTPEDNAK